MDHQIATGTWPQRHVTWLQPELFSTGHWHFGQGFVFAVIHVLFSLSPEVLSSHMRHLRLHETYITSLALQSTTSTTLITQDCALASISGCIAPSVIWQQEAHMSQEQGLCGAWQQAKQNWWPHSQAGSQCGSLSTCTARPQCGTLGHLHAIWIWNVSACTHQIQNKQITP